MGVTPELGRGRTRSQVGQECIAQPPHLPWEEGGFPARSSLGREKREPTRAHASGTPAELSPGSGWSRGLSTCTVQGGKQEPSLPVSPAPVQQP